MRTNNRARKLRLSVELDERFDKDILFWLGDSRDISDRLKEACRTALLREIDYLRWEEQDDRKRREELTRLITTRRRDE